MTECAIGLPDTSRAVATLEFAISAPVLLLLLFGTVEYFNAFRIQMKLNAAAGQYAEMIADSTGVTMGGSDGPGGTLGDMCTAISYNLYPYKPSTLSVIMESTTVNSSGGTAQDWMADKSCPLYAGYGSFYESINLTTLTNTPRSMFTTTGAPGGNGSFAPGYTAISVQLTYVYTNVLPFLLSRSINFTAFATARPRGNKAPICTYQSGNNSLPCPGVY